MTSVIQLTHSDIADGAARAAYRIHHALRHAGVDSIMQVSTALAGDWTVQAPAGVAAPHLTQLRRAFGSLACLLQQTGNPTLHSAALLPSSWPSRLNASEAELIHMHWVNREMLSIEDIGCIRKPLVWTLHDMWAFSGAEHYALDTRWRSGYRRANRPAHEKGLDINRWVWRRKLRAWRRPIHIVTPSHWLADCVRQSALMRDWPVQVVQNAIDTGRWQPVEKALARKLMNLPADVPLIAFGAIGGARDPRKGFDLLQSSLQALRARLPELQLLVFGQMAPCTPPELGFTTHFTGHLHDDLSLRILYSAADAFIIPSRQDNLPNTGLESLACGTPVVAFDTGGLPDIVQHRENGYLAEPFAPDSLAEGIVWAIGDATRQEALRHAARASAVRRYSYEVVAPLYRQVYAGAIAAGR